MPGRQGRPGRRPPGGRPPADPQRQRDSRPASPRDVAYAVIHRVTTSDAYANLVLPHAISRAGLRGRDAAFATELAYGTLRRLGTLDWVLSLHADRPLDAIEPEVRDVLRLGAYQIVDLGVAAHAAVGETVTLAPQRATGFVNAILRRLAEARDSIPWPSREGDLVSYLSIRFAHPRWIVDRWLDELGPRDTEALLVADGETPGVGLRLNGGADRDEVRDRLIAAGHEVSVGRWSDRALTVRGGGAPSELPGFASGELTPQDEASILVADALAGEPHVVDLCAGPGGKSSALADAGATVIAADVHPHRARLVSDGAARIGVSQRLHVVVADATSPPLRDGLSAILVDAPCSGLGVLRRRPEARWRVRPEDVTASAALQDRLIRTAFALLRPGGRLVYAVCTVTRAETVDVVGRLLSREPSAILDRLLPDIPRHHGSGDDLLLLPHIHGTDGMYVAQIRKTP